VRDAALIEKCAQRCATIHLNFVFTHKEKAWKMVQYHRQTTISSTFSCGDMTYFWSFLFLHLTTSETHLNKHKISTDSWLLILKLTNIYGKQTVISAWYQQTAVPTSVIAQNKLLLLESFHIQKMKTGLNVDRSPTLLSVEFRALRHNCCAEAQQSNFLRSYVSFNIFNADNDLRARWSVWKCFQLLWYFARNGIYCCTFTKELFFMQRTFCVALFHFCEDNIHDHIGVENTSSGKVFRWSFTW